MDNLLESNERTLVMFDAVCSGLAECLALVHSDIRQMTEHRNRLELELHQQKPANPPRHHKSKHCSSCKNKAAAVDDDDDDCCYEQVRTNNIIMNYASERHHHRRQPAKDEPDEAELKLSSPVEQGNLADQHQFAHLKLLDKRLADTFSQALSMCNEPTGSVKRQSKGHHPGHQSSAKPSIFQVLLGKAQPKIAPAVDTQSQPADDPSGDALDAKSLIDDINRQTRLALQYSKQLETNLFRVEDLRAKYEMHLKMGLVVKSISKTYLTCSAGNGGGVPGSPRQQQQQLNKQHQYSSSMVVNDSSSLGTRSSASSLNLSTWSFSRSRRREQRDAENQLKRRQASFGSKDYPCQVNQNNINNNNKLGQQQKYVSTISLDSHNKRKRRGLNLSRLISSTAVIGNKQKNGHPAAMHYIDQHSASLSRRPGGHQPHHQTATMCTTQRPYSLMESDLTDGAYHHRDIERTTSKLAAYADWEDTLEAANHGSGDSPYEHAAYLNGYQDQSLEYAAISPTTTATMASDTIRSNSASLSKSPSHSSLKRVKSKGQLVGSGASSQSKTTIKEFIENIERIESEFESYLGTFMLVIEDIQGFARVCQGDVFEISIKYGLAQKFKSKISVLKDNRQKCDHRQAIFKVRVADVLAIKAYECKGLSKRILLGHKLCETHDFFTARSQLMTISLNQTGSIKLNMIITWSPLVLTSNSIQ